MFYGHEKHVPSPDDLTILSCFCGWRSGELTRAEVADLGVPLWCQRHGCRAKASWVTFHPRERERALACLP